MTYLYGNDTVSSFELAKGYSKPIDTDSPPVLVPDDIVKSHEELRNVVSTSFFDPTL